MAHRFIRDIALAPVIGAIAVLIAGGLTLVMDGAGPLTIQMAQHIAVMNVLAPLLAAAVWAGSLRGNLSWAIWIAAFTQIALLWTWHAPAVQLASATSFPVHLALLASLFLIALAFWMLVLDAGRKGQWRSLGALLLTGKLACLLGVLMIFATRDVYTLQGVSIPFCTTGPSTLADQQLAGLLMITACPLSYLVAGVVIAAQIIASTDEAADKDLGHAAVR